MICMNATLARLILMKFDTVLRRGPRYTMLRSWLDIKYCLSCISGTHIPTYKIRVFKGKGKAFAKIMSSRYRVLHFQEVVFALEKEPMSHLFLFTFFCFVFLLKV